MNLRSLTALLSTTTSYNNNIYNKVSSLSLSLSAASVSTRTSSSSLWGGLRVFRRRNSSSSHLSLLPVASAMTTTSSTTTTTTALNSIVASDRTETSAPKEIFRLDYKPLPRIVSDVKLDFDIHDNLTTVTAHLQVKPNEAVTATATATVSLNDDLVLDGDETCVKLLSLKIDGRDLEAGTDYEVVPGELRIKASVFPAEGECTLSTVVEIIPEENTQLSGFYKSGPMYCSQCEATGFRRITYFPDRPDNMATYSQVRIEAKKGDYPVLLSNGNLLESGDVKGGDRHYAVWQDPFPKPSYLFAIVAGNLGSIKDKYTTMNGREVDLEIFSEVENVGKLDYAMDSLKRSMKWDEDTFGLEYDLDLYNIVAVNDFNMGAMENKGLNVFNTAYVLADPKTASDVDYQRVEGVIGHEYFHNWTGNRVTCQDWFQLTLKEGLTVFRDQQFSGDMNSRAVKRIEDVKGLRGRQFNEDAGPMSHPIRPESYISMDNFYTATVYSKGAEIIRMYDTLLTSEGFRKGMDLYFARHDGQAVTCDDFRAAMADANGVDLDQFGLWYSTPGTPTITYSTSYDSESKKFTLTLQQKSNSESPLHIPVSVGLVDKNSGKEVHPTKVLELKELEQKFEFNDIESEPVPSILRQFSAPVKLVSSTGSVDEESLAFLAAYDTDGFNKWEAGQKLYTSFIFQTLADSPSEVTKKYVFEAFKNTLIDKTTGDNSIKAYALTLPSEGTLAEDMEVVDPVGLHKARGIVKTDIAREFYNEIKSLYDELTSEMEADSDTFKVDAEACGRRLLRNVLLDYLCSVKDTSEEKLVAASLATKHFESASGMTDKLAGLNALASMDGEGANARDQALESFYKDANGDALVLNKWFSVQAMANLPDVLDRVKELTKHPDFTLNNPNRCRSLISAFAMNSAPFHVESGEGYKFIGEILAQVDKLNPQLSSRLASSLIQWKRYDEKRGELMKAELQKLVSLENISPDMFEIVSRGLK